LEFAVWIPEFKLLLVFRYRIKFGLVVEFEKLKVNHFSPRRDQQNFAGAASLFGLYI
jgi:hypothetical protein